jgi:hypothetical protein
VDARIRSGQSVLEPRRARYQRAFSHADPDPAPRQKFLRARTYHAITAICGPHSNVPVEVPTGLARSPAKWKMMRSIHGYTRSQPAGRERRAQGRPVLERCSQCAAVTPPAPRPCEGRRNKWLPTRRGSSATTMTMRRPSSLRCSHKNLGRLACGLRRVRRRRVRSRL